MNLAASAILDESEKEVLDNAHALLSCEEPWSNPMELPNKLNMPDLLPTDPSDITANNIDLHPVQDGEVQYPFDFQPFPTPLLDTLPVDSDTAKWPQLQSSTRIQPTSSENITDDPDKEMNNITPVVPEAPVIDWEGLIQSGLSFSSTYESTNAADVNMEDPLYCPYDLDDWFEVCLKRIQEAAVNAGFVNSVFVLAEFCSIQHSCQSLVSKKKGTEDYDEVCGDPAGGEYTSSSFLENFGRKVDWLSCTATLNSIQRPRMAILLRLRLECLIVEALLSHFTDVHTGHGQSMPPAQTLYHVSREGVENFQPMPVGRAKPWKSLPKVASAPLDTWSLRCGDVVSVDVGHGRGYAKVSDLRSIHDGRYVVVYTWLYTRDEVAEELQVDGNLSPSSRAHLDKMWPSKARHKYMLSTNRTITVWDTAIERAPDSMLESLCYSAIYSTTPRSRHIWSVENPRFKWMKRILLLDPQPKMLI